MLMIVKHQVTMVTFWAATVSLLLSGCTVYAFGLSETTSYDTLVIKFESDRSQVRVGEAVHMRFTIKNVGSKSWVIESQDTPVMDISVSVVGGGKILNWSEQNLDLVSHRLEWQPGESKVIEWSWTPQQGDVYSGAFRDIFLTGSLNERSKVVHAAGVRVCASDVCR